ncbi:tyrosine-type recombinase/integrase [Acetatifactor muris]|uniref:Tyrosine recombinase XerC n=1 Tax=Acetatifactor muris TaxID=879566 RepID=A0A2K4ZNT2_9FIRM|nr:site-specific tyrosine recombinase/integron integrase [Acetatifactor muris]MCR2050374.1 tyrosine-type recombinase/integrase [Acetatifactor muris]SOY32042.1 Tyrosine recombinase XerC [Acetatifactor muris]
MPISTKIKMDIRLNIIQAIVNHLVKRVDNETINIIQDILTIELNNYELQERCTQIIVRDNSNENLLKKYIATKRVEGASDATLKRYKEQNIALLNYIGKPIKEITTYDIRFYLSIKRDRDKVSNRTLDGMRRCYNSFFKWLTTEEFISKNPCASLSQIKYKKTVKKPYSATEMEKLRNACENARDLALVEFLYSTGCRVSEVAQLDIMDIDFENMQCTVLGKGNKERIVYMTEVANMYLQEYICGRKDFSEALFIGKGGKRLSKNGIEVLLKRLGKKANVENVHPHRYRRTLATNLLDHGMNIQDVATILGHADLKTTQVYCYISQKNVQNSYRKFAS